MGARAVGSDVGEVGASSVLTRGVAATWGTRLR